MRYPRVMWLSRMDPGEALGQERAVAQDPLPRDPCSGPSAWSRFGEGSTLLRPGWDSPQAEGDWKGAEILGPGVGAQA